VSEPRNPPRSATLSAPAWRLAGLRPDAARRTATTPAGDTVTCGGLPLGVFEHSAPSAVALLDLDRGLTPVAPDGGPCRAGTVDALLLIRLHDEPLATLHVDGDVTSMSGSELLAALWPRLASVLAAHTATCGCGLECGDPLSLAAALPASNSASATAGPRDTGLSAAVILCTAGRPLVLERCVRSLLAQTRAPDEVLIVDNRPADGQTLRIAHRLAGEDNRVRYVAEPRAGLSVARNRGVAHTDCDVVAFTDDDVLTDPGWLSWLLDGFAEPRVGVCCGLVLPLELQSAAQKRFELYDGFCKGLERRSFTMRDGQGHGRLLFPFVNGMVGTGNSMAFRRRELVALGGFDPALGAGSPARAGEETCAFAAAILAGGRIIYQPRALCWHEHRRDEQALRSQVLGYGVSVGAILARAVASRDSRLFDAAARALVTLAGNGGTPEPDHGGRAARPAELDRIRRAGMLQGPLRYLQGVRRARRLGLHEHAPGEPIEKLSRSG